MIRKIERNKEKLKLKELRKTYNKKPKQKCPKCGKKNLFYTNKDGETYCIRCNKIIDKKVN